jgi:hypothetical protein
MNTILISYDLKTPGKDYQKLWDYLKTYPSWAKPLESVWILKTNFSTKEVRDNLLSYIDANDKILIIDVTDRSSSWKNLSANISTWIQANL